MFLEVGRVGKPHGVRGDVFVSFTSDVDERRRVGASLWLDPDGTGEPLVIETVRAQQDRHVVGFRGLTDRDAAAALTNKLLYAPSLDGQDGLWVHRLIGSEVVDVAGTRWGTCRAVVANPAHDIIELDDGVLVPVPFVVSCDGSTTVIDPPEGLREALEAR